MIKVDLFKDQKIKWEGITNFPELYKYMKLWFEDNGYIKDEKSLEKKYLERIKPEGKKQLEVSWHGEKNKSGFFTYNIDLTILILGMSEVEVQQNGDKVKMQKGTFEIRISSFIKSTPEWEELKGFQKLYQELFIKKRIDEYVRELYSKSANLHSYIKGFLGLRD